MIKNFIQDDLIHIGNNSIIIHGKNEHIDYPACIKILNQEFPSSDQSWYFENEFEFSSNTNCSSVRKALSQTTVENHKGIVFEYIDGIDLKKYLHVKERPFEETLSVALKLVHALTELHKENIIHNNISPGNILIEKGTSKIYLIDLQIASRNRLKLDDTNNQIIRKAALSYIAPEHTGRVNRIIDYRTDLYSLGVVLYEMFAGKTPFEYLDPIELIYAHLAKTPIPPDQVNKELSPVLSAIIMKLLAKNGEDRYQSAIGVYNDLNYLHNNKADSTNFIVGQNDFSGKLLIHPKLYGKENDQKKLYEIFETCAAGTCELLFVYGYSGSGKTSLINELQRPVSDSTGFFVSGKFDQVQQNQPYSAFILAFRELINHILIKDQDTLDHWKNKILDKVGNLGKVLTDLIPGIEALIGKQPALPQLSGVELRNRFNYVLGNFINAIASKEHPLVIFIDDLQWADGSSLNLLDLIATDKKAKYITLIGAYRDNEVTEDSPLIHLIDKLNDEDVPFHGIEVVNLEQKEVQKMIDELLRTEQGNSSELAQIIYTKTKGNPFYIHRFLQSIYDEGKLYFDFDKKIWCWNTEHINELNVSGNVADLMKSAVTKLPARTIEVLKVAACLGIRFDLDKLSVSTGVSENTLQRILQLPLAEGLIISATTHYKFAHDRIHQTIYSLLTETDKQLYHLKIAKALSENTTEEDINEHIFEIVSHWNLADDCIGDQETKYYVADLNQLAGRKAKVSAAYQQAYLYFDKGVQLLAHDSWENNYDFTLNIYNDAAEVAFLCGEMELAEQLVTKILANVRQLKDGIKAHEVKIQKLIAGNHQNEAIETGLEVLKKYGIKFPAKPGKLSIIIGVIRINMMLKNKPSSFFENLPLVQDPEKLATYRILSDMLSAGYFAAPNLVPLLIFKMVELSVKDGLSPKSPFAFAALGYILSGYMGKVDKGIEYGNIALNVSNNMRTAELQSRTLMTYNMFLVHWKMRLSDINEEIEKAYKSALETGDHEYSCYLASNITYNSFYSGVQLYKLADKSEILSQQIDQFKQYLTSIRLRTFRQSIANLIYDTTEPAILAGDIFDERQPMPKETTENYPFFENLYLQKLFLAVTFNRSKEAYTYAVTCEKYQESIRGSVLDLVFYFYQALAITEVYESSDPKTKPALLKKVKGNLKQLKKFEGLCKENYKQKRLLVEAELCKIEGNEAKARSLYDYTLKIAVEHHIIQDEAICWERTGRFYLGQKHYQVAEFYLNNALNAYQRWGADAKVKEMTKVYDGLKKTPGQKISETFSKDSNDQPHVDIDMATILKVSTALSGEIVLSNLLKKMMQILIENAGAQQGFLINEKNSERFIEAEFIAETGEVTTLQSKPLNITDGIARSIVNYVSLKRETVLLDNAAESTLFGDDEYIKKHKAKSILCMPLINQGKLQGIIYLANNITLGAFTEKRLDFIRLISGQITISIENALFYDRLEQRVEERTNELKLEKKKSDDLLLNILPEEIANELKQTGRTQPRSYDMVTVMFTDFKDFTVESENLTPEELVTLVDSCFRKFDEITTFYNIEKIKTIGDAYLCVSGLPNPHDHNPTNVVKAALEIIDYIKKLRIEHHAKNKSSFDIRIGIHTGPIVAGVVGNKKFAYDIWGDTVNTAARMEQTSETNRINISETTYNLIKDNFSCTERGKQHAKNKGYIEMFFVDKELANVASNMAG